LILRIEKVTAAPETADRHATKLNLEIWISSNSDAFLVSSVVSIPWAPTASIF